MAGRNTEHHLTPRVREALKAAGYVFERRNKHIIFRHPVTRQILTFALTTGDTNMERIQLRNIRRAVAQAGHR